LTVELIDSYSETNQDQVDFLTQVHPSAVAEYSGVAHSFKPIKTCRLSSVKFYLRKTLNPVGNMVARLYKHQGVYGTSSKPTDTVLAESTPVTMASLNAGPTFALTEFTFPAGQKYRMIIGEPYCVACVNKDASTLNGTNRPDLGLDSSAGTHSGNECEYLSSAWATYATEDVCFYLYADESEYPKTDDLQFKNLAAAATRLSAA